MEHIMLDFLGSQEEIVRSSALGNSVKVCCFNRTMLQLSRLALLWLPSMIVINPYNVAVSRIVSDVFASDAP